jgi:putative ABC transport system permease protein
MRDDVLADLEELYVRRAAREGFAKARRWYRAQVLSYATRFGAERVRSAFGRDSGGRRERRGRGRRPAVSWLDWKLGARMLLKHPALTIIGGISLAAAIAIGSVGMEVAGELLYKRLPFAEGERVVAIETQDAATSRVEPRVLHDFAIWRESLESITELGAARLVERNVLTGEGRVEPLRVAEITASAFPLTRVPPLLGRPLQPADEVPGAEPVVVLGYDVWQTAVPGRPVHHRPRRVRGPHGATVVGVMPPASASRATSSSGCRCRSQDAPPREGPPVQVFGRLATARTWQAAAAELEAVSARLAADNPVTHGSCARGCAPTPGRTPGDPLRMEELLIHAVVLLVLGAVCANVATLIFARTAMRESEIVVRNALGASRARVITQIVTESLVLHLPPRARPGRRADHRALRGRAHHARHRRGAAVLGRSHARAVTIAYALLLALTAAVLIGVLPALKATGAVVRRACRT